MKIETLRDLLIVKIMALYDIETVISEALPKMVRAAGDPELRASFEGHLLETESHIERLEKIFEEIDVKPKKMKVEAIRGIVEDSEWAIKQKPSPNLLDALLIASARYVEHYEMAGYLSAIAWAESLGLRNAVDLLEATLDEEKAADIKLETAMRRNVEASMVAD